jgi:DNA-binding MltR family transcriptional regulator
MLILTEDLNKESERGQVLLAASALDEALKRLLAAYFLKDPKIQEAVFSGGSAPAGPFSNRIKLCYLLGLISEEEFRDLETIRSIRNDFAHKLDQAISKQSLEDRTQNIRHARRTTKELETETGIRPSRQDRFSVAVAWLFMNLRRREQAVAKNRRTFDYGQHQIGGA